MGAWIEMTGTIEKLKKSNRVAPLMGAWIEILISEGEHTFKVDVAPLMGAWIEISMSTTLFLLSKCRAPHGRVD